MPRFRVTNYRLGGRYYLPSWICCSNIIWFWCYSFFYFFNVCNKIEPGPETLKFQLVVSTYVGTELVNNMYSRGCEIIIGEMMKEADLIKLGETEYDRILEMNWLSTYHARVNWHQKKTIFLEGAPKYVLFEGMKNKLNIPIISAIKAAKLLRHGYRGFMATVVDKKDDEINVENIAVVIKDLF